MSEASVAIAARPAAGGIFEVFKLLKPPDAIWQCCFLLEDNFNPIKTIHFLTGQFTVLLNFSVIIAREIEDRECKKTHRLL